MANDLSAFASEAWSKKVVQNLDQMNVMLPLVNRNWEGDLRFNKTVYVRTFGNVSMRPYVANTTVPTSEDLKPQKEAFTVADASYFQFQIDDVDVAQNDLKAMDGYAQRAAVAVSNTIEAKLAAAYVRAGVIIGAANPGVGAILTPVITAGAVSSVTITAGGTGYTTPVTVYFMGGNGRGATATATQSGGIINNVTVTAGGTGYTIAPKVFVTSSTAVTPDSGKTATGVYNLFAQARTVLSNNNVSSAPGNRWAVVDPEATALVMNDTDHFVNSSDLGSNVVQTALVGGGSENRNAQSMAGFIGRIAGFNVFESTHVPVDAGGKYWMFGTNDAISYAAQIVSTEGYRSQTSFADVGRGLLLHDTFVSDEMRKNLVVVKATRT